MTHRLPVSFSGLMLLATLGGTAPAAEAQTPAQPVVAELTQLLGARPDLRDALVRAIAAADVKGIHSLDDFYGYVGALVTWIPVEREIVPKVLRIHYIVNHAPGDALNNDPAFSRWLAGVARAWGRFLDSPASAAAIQSFASLPEYRIDDYFPGPSGWLSFNQFFAREIRPGKRPIADPRDDAVIVSPADAVFMGEWPVDAGSAISVKGARWRIAQLLEVSPYADAFRNGLYMHSFLRSTDYHRFHAPVAGVVKEVRNVQGRVYLDVVRQPDGSLGARNGDTYQFNQERGFIVMDSPEVGLVAIVPVGMTFISSVVLTPRVGAHLRKGDELGYFQFGGSDIVMIFQDRNVVLEAEPGEKVLQGQRIGHLQERE